MKTSPCKGCGAPIIWTLSPKGANLPVDATPIDYRNAPAKQAQYSLLEDPDGHVMAQKVSVISPDTDPERNLVYISHFATCPQVNRFSRKA